MLLGRMKKYQCKEKIFECLMHYGDHLLITENLEEPAGVMEESETGIPWSCWALYFCVVPLGPAVHARGQCKCVCLWEVVAGAAVSLLIRFCLSETLYDLHKLHMITISDHLCRFMFLL